jgi:thiamine biosynthesis lipoprotein ApbE
MKTFGLDFKEDVGLDRFKLEEESEALSSIYAYYASQQAEAHAEADKAKKELDRIKATKELYLRRNPPMDVKLTESTVIALVQEASEVIDAENNLLSANEKLYNLDSAIYALNQKKSGLEYLVNLWERGYYSQEGARKSEETYDDIRRNRKE